MGSNQKVQVAVVVGVGAKQGLGLRWLAALRGRDSTRLWPFDPSPRGWRGNSAPADSTWATSSLMA
jgi:hypothetical protein